MDTVFVSVVPTVNGCEGPEYIFEFYVKPLPSLQLLQIPYVRMELKVP